MRGSEVQIELGVILYFLQDVPVDGIVGDLSPKAFFAHDAARQVIFVEANWRIAFWRDKDPRFEFLKKLPRMRVFLRKMAHALRIFQERPDKIGYHI